MARLGPQDHSIHGSDRIGSGSKKGAVFQEMDRHPRTSAAVGAGLRVLLCCFVAAYGQDTIAQTLRRIDTRALVWANIIIVIGPMILGVKYLLMDRHDHGSVWTTIIDAVFLLGARALATYFLPTPAP